ncbi:MAG TPA: hypothetical protein VGJ91_23580 [Polyangiaceae bacterium]
MKKTMLIATFLAVGAGSAGVSALDLKGSDTLKEFTLSVINAAVCPNATSINYLGGGSGTGEAAMTTSPVTQSVAPMSRFLQVGGATPALAEGVAYGADGITISASKAHSACDPNAASGTGCGAQAGGLRQSGTLNGGAYTLGTAAVAGWRDVLRLVFFGLENSTGSNPSPTAAPPVRNCSSPVRADLVNNYGNLFENAACGAGGCTQLSHAWRRDNLSSTTDVFRELVTAKAYPFCSNRFASDPISSPSYPTVLSTGAALYDDAYQDFDTIRRPCQGGGFNEGAFLPAPTNGNTVQPPFAALPAEQVCSPVGSLGLVLTVRAPVGYGIAGSEPPATDIAVTDAFPSKPCLRGKFIFGPAPKVPGSATKDTLCPNGDLPLSTPNPATAYNAATGQVVGSSGVCLIPAAADGDAQCINGRNNLPAVANPQIPDFNASDGRLYNLHMYSAGQSPTYRVDVEVGKTISSTTNRQIIGDFARIHSTRTLIAASPTCPGTAGSGRCCDKADSTHQIGCLVAADACSIGFSGPMALDQALVTSTTTEQAFGASLAGVGYRQECIENSAYPASRRLYLGSSPGFESASLAERALAVCFSGNTAGGASQFASLLALNSLTALPNGPRCQPFVVGGSACANNPVGIAP